MKLEYFFFSCVSSERVFSPRRGKIRKSSVRSTTTCVGTPRLHTRLPEVLELALLALHALEKTRPQHTRVDPHARLSGPVALLLLLGPQEREPRVRRPPVRQTPAAPAEEEGDVPVPVLPDVRPHHQPPVVGGGGGGGRRPGDVDRDVDLVLGVVRPPRAVAVAHAAPALVGPGRRAREGEADAPAVACCGRVRGARGRGRGERVAWGEVWCGGGCHCVVCVCVCLFIIQRWSGGGYVLLWPTDSLCLEEERKVALGDGGGRLLSPLRTAASGLHNQGGWQVCTVSAGPPNLGGQIHTCHADLHM